jgi:hypothetical protein
MSEVGITIKHKIEDKNKIRDKDKMKYITRT